MSQHKLDLLLAHIRILTGSNQVHNGTNTTVDRVQCALSRETCRKQHLNQVVSQVGEVFFFILYAHQTQVVDDLACVV